MGARRNKLMSTKTSLGALNILWGIPYSPAAIVLLRGPLELHFAGIAAIAAIREPHVDRGRGSTHPPASELSLGASGAFRDFERRPSVLLPLRHVIHWYIYSSIHVINAEIAHKKPPSLGVQCRTDRVSG